MHPAVPQEERGFLKVGEEPETGAALVQSWLELLRLAKSSKTPLGLTVNQPSEPKPPAQRATSTDAEEDDSGSNSQDADERPLLAPENRRGATPWRRNANAVTQKGHTSQHRGPTTLSSALNYSISPVLESKVPPL